MICRKCGSTIPEDSAFCPVCGTRTEGGSFSASGGDGVCPVCGGRYEYDDMFCPTCGNDLSKYNRERNKNFKKQQKSGPRSGLFIAGGAVCVLALCVIAGAAAVNRITAGKDDSGMTAEINRKTTDQSVYSGGEENAVPGDVSNSLSGGEKEEVSVSAQEPADDVTEGGIHRYQFVIKDCGWNEAFRDALNRGGYLVRINSQEEYDHILSLISQNGYDKVHFYLGGRKEDNTGYYCWVDERNDTYGQVLNGNADAWCCDDWMAGEPSYQDPNLGIEESYMNLFYYSEEGRWVLNDGPENIPNVVSEYRGLTGYIIEYED